MWDDGDFSGTKIALIAGSDMVVYLRDDKAGIPFPGLWDVPGGGREGSENPITCALREVAEEFGLTLPPERVTHLTRYPSATADGLDTYFCIATITGDEVKAIRFGDEGQRWLMMPIAEFLIHPQAIAHLKRRLEAALSLT